VPWSRHPLHIAFADLTKAFYMVGCTMFYKKSAVHVRSLHDDTEARILFEDVLSSPFELKCGVKQACILAPTLIGFSFAVFHHDDKNGTTCNFSCTPTQRTECSILQDYLPKQKIGISRYVICYLRTMLLSFHIAKLAFRHKRTVLLLLVRLFL